MMRYFDDGIVYNYTMAKNKISEYSALHSNERWGYGSIVDQSGNVIGSAGLTPADFRDGLALEMAFLIVRRLWGHGYGTEIAEALLHWGLDGLRVEELIATSHPDNHHALMVIEKIGMERVGEIIIAKRGPRVVFIKHP